MNDEDIDRERILAGVKTVGSAFTVAVVVFFLTMFGSAAMVEVATLAAAVAVLGWFATVDPARLVSDGGDLEPIPFALAGLGALLVGATAVVVQTATLFLVGALAAAAPIVGVVRALPRRDDGSL